MRIWTSTGRRLRATATSFVLALGVVGLLAGCTETISGTPGPAPTVSSGGDFPSGSATPTAGDTTTAEPTDTGSTEPTDTPPTDTQPTDTQPTDTGEPTEDGSPAELCATMSDTISGPDFGAEGYQALIGLDILGWGLGNGDSDPFATVDEVTIAACPDVRTAVLAKTQTPDLKTLGN